MITYFNPPNNYFTAKDIHRYEQVERLYFMIKNDIRNAVNTGYSNVHYDFENDADAMKEIIERLKDDYFRVERDDKHVTIYWD